VVAGLRYGEGILYTKNAGDLRVFWQGPSLGYDFGVDGARTMMLVYNLPATDAIYQRFAGNEGSAYLVAGLGMPPRVMNNTVVVPIRTGVGIRLGANVGYLKFTPTATWNPFLTGHELRRFMCGWPPPGKRKCNVPHRSRLQSCVRPVHAVRMDCWP